MDSRMSGSMDVFESIDAYLYTSTVSHVPKRNSHGVSHKRRAECLTRSRFASAFDELHNSLTALVDSIFYLLCKTQKTVLAQRILYYTYPSH